MNLSLEEFRQKLPYLKPLNLNHPYQWCKNNLQEIHLLVF
jgi:hypothetical protein